MKIVYGPVASWRLGKSLGVDVICKPEKICSFDCVYCQLEKTRKITSEREIFVPTEMIKHELNLALKKTTPDVITLSGMGEPTLAKNNSEIIDYTRCNTDIPIAILTNSSLFVNKDVQKSLCKLDIIVAKLDAPNEDLFQKINRPAKGISFKKTLDGILDIRNKFQGKFALQMMFINENKDYAEEMANIARAINPDEVQINTPLRPCKVEPLDEKTIDKIENIFDNLPTITVYKSPKPKTDPLDKIDLIKRRRMEL
jgi:wyosine [tRNA(Phe)-imidazoG37] synthetase (radical SAM superfamily)